MAKYKINQSITINGVKRWITANSMQEFADKVTRLLGTPQDRGKHLFVEYAWNWYNTYSAPNVETATATTYKRQIRLYLIPAFDGLAVEDITFVESQGHRLIYHTAEEEYVSAGTRPGWYSIRFWMLLWKINSSRPIR